MADLSDLPKVDVLARSPMLDQLSAPARIRAARRTVALMRSRRLAGEQLTQSDESEILAASAAREASLRPRPVINMSGVILHTGLGRARLAPQAITAVRAAAESHIALEIDLDEGARGNRQDMVGDLLTQLTGAEDALVVNNAAGAVLLALSALCSGREVILSRGQMVEIGGSFRMPDIVRQSGCQLVEVGCTNKTRAVDYEAAIGAGTAALLRCHPSNFKVIGFTHEASLAELAAIARRHELLAIDDQGSGCVANLQEYGLPRQETLQEAVQAGADVVIASGDKLLGGPQAGVLLGRRGLIARCAQHPLARALRVDKFSLAALAATLRLHLDGERAQIPLYKYLGKSLGEVRACAESISLGLGLDLVESLTEVGAGSAPGSGIPTLCLALPGNAEDISRRLRAGSPTVIGRIHEGRVLLDARTVDSDEVVAARSAIVEALT